jgi:hypothetical protein
MVTCNLLQAQLFLDTGFVRFMDQGIVCQPKLPLFGFLRKNMALEGVLSFDLSRPG